jgi:hypothetical protein
MRPAGFRAGGPFPVDRPGQPGEAGRVVDRVVNPGEVGIVPTGEPAEQTGDPLPGQRRIRQLATIEELEPVPGVDHGRRRPAAGGPAVHDRFRQGPGPRPLRIVRGDVGRMPGVAIDENQPPGDDVGIGRAFVEIGTDRVQEIIKAVPTRPSLGPRNRRVEVATRPA